MKKEIIKLNEAEFNAIERGKNYGCVPYWTKISPIRLLRSRANVSLAEAKEAVEFAIKYWKEMSLTWDDYNTNFELWEEAGVDPVPVVKDETAMRWFTTCPCGCQRRFEVIPPVEVTIVPTLDDDAEDPLLGDEEEIEEIKDEEEGEADYDSDDEGVIEARAKRQQGGYKVEHFPGGGSVKVTRAFDPKKEVKMCVKCKQDFATFGDLKLHVEKMHRRIGGV